MIKIDKSNIPTPAILLLEGVNETTKNKNLFSLGKFNLSFNNSVYGHSSVKKTLNDLQNDKCCFCERKISAGEPGHIEHYRPKGGYKINSKSKLIKPGYYWLAYDFHNLFLSCNKCNTSYKKNYFPLKNENDRAKNHNSNIKLEEPLILCPSDDIKPHLVFKSEIIKPKNKSLKGSETIQRIGLNRKYLADDRLTYLKPLKLLAEIVKNSPNNKNAKEIKNLFKESGKETSEFSYMVACNFPTLV
jgi:uncharacterized protein (TIGR02646 family)